MSRRGSVVCARSGDVRIAVGAHHILGLAGDPPSSQAQQHGWWEVPEGEGRRWIDVGAPGEPRWLLLGDDVEVLQASELTMFKAPALVARHLGELGVVRLFRDRTGLGFVVDPRRLPPGDAA